jgi:hypothetical protein
MNIGRIVVLLVATAGLLAAQYRPAELGPLPWPHFPTLPIAPSPDPKIEAQRRRCEFEHKIDAFVTAFNEFANEYNASGGLLWDRKKAQKIKKLFDRAYEDPAWIK